MGLRASLSWWISPIRSGACQQQAKANPSLRCPVWHFLSFLEAAFRAMSVLNVQAIRSIIYRLVCEQPEMTEDFPGLPKPNPICYSRVAWTLQVVSRQEHGLGEFSGECFQAWDLSSPEYKTRELLLPSNKHPKIVFIWVAGEHSLADVTGGVIAGQFGCSVSMLRGMSSAILVFLAEKGQPTWNKKSFCLTLGAKQHRSKKRLENGH